MLTNKYQIGLEKNLKELSANNEVVHCLHCNIVPFYHIIWQSAVAIHFNYIVSVICLILVLEKKLEVPDVKQLYNSFLLFLW